MNKKVCVLGLGYIGLPTASLLATAGASVTGVDVSREIVRTINSGRIHIVEPDLDVLVHSAVQSGKLKAVLRPEPADVFIIAVPTPFKQGHEPDLSYVHAATSSLIPVIRAGNLVILESTSPVGTTDQVARWLRKDRADLKKIHVAHCPERVLPGRILKELLDNDRVIGGIDEASTEAAMAFYRQFVSGDLLATDARTAEMCKLTENACRDVNIAFANELSMLCERFKVDVWELIRLANHHPRVKILNPGPGVGGHCIAVDPWFIVSAEPETARLMRAAREINDSKPEWVLARVREQTVGKANPVIGCLGLAFKPDIDDLRESPALAIVRRLQKEKIGTIMACEPNVKELKGVSLFPLDKVIARADIILALVAHRQFRELDKKLLAGKVVIDTCGVWR
jgi:UDP-N-acetyl-D-mannosaminuronic acid dehydrogenase